MRKEGYVRASTGRILALAIVFLLLAGLSQVTAAGTQESGYPNKNIKIIIPTGKGGAMDRAVQAVTAVWREYLGVEFESSFHPGASGEVGYTLFTKQPADGYTILAGNIGPEMIMYALQEPDYKFPEDYIYFATIDADPAVIWVQNDSPFQTIQDLVNAAKTGPVKISTSRYPHPATLGALLLAEATGAQFNIIPYGGGSPARTAGLTGEVDAVTTHLGSSLDLAPQIRFLVMFQKENKWPQLSDNAPTATEAFGATMPALGANRGFAIARGVKENYPDRYNKLVTTFKQAVDDPRFKEELKKVGLDPQFLDYQGEESAMQSAKDVLELATNYKDLLKGGK